MAARSCTVTAQYWRSLKREAGREKTIGDFAPKLVELTTRVCSAISGSTPVYPNGTKEAHRPQPHRLNSAATRWIRARA